MQARARARNQPVEAYAKVHIMPPAPERTYIELITPSGECFVHQVAQPSEPAIHWKNNVTRFGDQSAECWSAKVQVEGNL